MGHVLHKNSLDKRKRKPFKVVIIKCVKISKKKIFILLSDS